MEESHINRFLTGDLSETECREFYDWVKASDSNRRLFSSMKNIWTLSGGNEQLSDADLQREYQRFNARRTSEESRMEADSNATSRKHTLGYYLLRIAAVLLILYGTGITYLHLQHKEDVAYYEIQTHRGEKSQLLLSDGTRIWINSDSRLRYPTSMTKRNVVVYLDGEAYFEVARVKGREFVVHTADIDITALGTSFNVKSYKDEGMVETTLEEGKILITGDVPMEKLKKPLLLLPNQRATIYTHSEGNQNPTITETYPTADGETAAAGKPVEPVRQRDVVIQHQTNTAIYTSWKDGNLQFRKERFEDLAVLLERWYDVKISINDAEIKEWRYTGTFDKETIEQALTALSLSMPFRFAIHKNSVTIER